MQDIIKKHFEDLATANWDSYRSALAPDCVYEELATQQRVQGPEAYVALVKRWKVAFPDLKAVVREIAMTGDRCVAEVEWHGTHKGTLEASFGVIPPTNKQCQIKASLVMKLENGKIRESHHYFDLLTMMTQLGLAPSISGISAPGAAKPAQAAKRP